MVFGQAEKEGENSRPFLACTDIQAVSTTFSTQWESVVRHQGVTLGGAGREVAEGEGCNKVKVASGVS